jgi:G3E family GTPase
VNLFERDRSAERLPVVVLTGFLGSGKTTLLNRLLRHPEFSDTAVIVNEFGDVPLDHHLVEAIDGEMVVLQSGCICCSLRSDLETGLRQLLGRRSQGRIPAFGRIVIETTGLADPAPIVQLLLNNPLVSRFLRLDSVCTTVDAVNAALQLKRHREAVKQVALADRLFITKSDISGVEGVADLRKRLAQINPHVVADEVRNGHIAPSSLFGAGWVDESGRNLRLADWLGLAAHDGHARHGAPSHDGEAIDSFCLSAQAPLDWRRLQDWLAGLRAAHGDKLLRVKGIVDIAGQDQAIVIHGVHHVFHPPVLMRQFPDQKRQTRIVFIVQGLARQIVADGFESIVNGATTSLLPRHRNGVTEMSSQENGGHEHGSQRH